MRKMILIATVLSLATAAHAAPSPGQKCESAKNQEAGKYAGCLSKAEAKLMKTEGSCSVTTATDCYGDGDCPIGETCTKDLTKYAATVTKCEDKFEASWGTLTQKAADAGDPCPDGLVATDIQAEVDEHVARVAARLSGERYVDNGDGTITDIDTGLMWAKQSDDASVHSLGKFYSWGSDSPPYPPNGTAFTDYIARLNGSADGSCFAGHCDWRLPTIEELQGLIVASEPPPKIDPIFKSPCTPGCMVTECSCTAPVAYWSASTHASIPDTAWSVNFQTGGFVQAIDKSVNVVSVRAVRGGS